MQFLGGFHVWNLHPVIQELFNSSPLVSASRASTMYMMREGQWFSELEGWPWWFWPSLLGFEVEEREKIEKVAWVKFLWRPVSLVFFSQQLKVPRSLFNVLILTATLCLCANRAGVRLATKPNLKSTIPQVVPMKTSCPVMKVDESPK